MALTTRTLSRLALGAVLLGATALLPGVIKVWQAHRFNQAIAERNWNQAATHASAHGRLAGAYAMAVDSEQPFSDRVQAYSGVIGATDDAAVLRPANYNLATLYLDNGLRLIDAEQRDQALPLLTLAKTMLRERLHDEPDHWDSKYNLEIALRAAPDVAEEPEINALPGIGPTSRAVGAQRSRQALP